MIFACPEMRCSKIQNRPHAGISYLRSFLEYKNFKTQYARHNEVFSLDEYVEFLLSYKSNIYGFSVTDDTLDIFLATSKKLKEVLKDCIIVVGGAIAKIETAEYLLNNKLCDAVTIGEGEIPTEALLNQIKKNGHIVASEVIPGVAVWDHKNNRMIYKKNVEQIDINSYPSPILSGMIPDEDLAENGILSSRGCFHRCIYCSFSTVSEWKTQYYDEERFLQEVEKIISVLDEKNIDEEIPIWDDAFTLVPARAKRLLRGIAERNSTNRKFWLQTRIDKIDEELISLMKNAGIDHVGIGLESASPKVLKTVRKVRLKDFDEPGYEPEESFLKKFDEFSNWCRKYKLEYTINAILGLPGETYEEALTTIEFVQNLKPKFYFHAYLRLYTGVPLAHEYNKYGYKINSINYNEENFKYPVQAKVVNHNYDITKVPPLPYRLKPLDIMAVNGLIKTTLGYKNTILIEDTNKLDYNSQYLNKKEVLKYNSLNKIYSENTEILTHNIESIAEFTIPENKKIIFKLAEVNFSELKEFFPQLLHHYEQNSYERYAKQAETILMLKTDNSKDYELIDQLSKVFDKGGILQLPDNITSFQFKNIMLKDGCKWHEYCPAEDDMRTYITKDGMVKTCEQGIELGKLNINTISYKDTFQMNKEVIEEKRKCKECLAYKRCSKCMSVPQELVKKYCEIQKRKMQPASIISIIDYIIAQIINPLDLSVYQTTYNMLVVDSDKARSLCLILRIGEQYFYVYKSNSNFKILKVGSTIFECILEFWKDHRYESIKEYLIKKYNVEEKITEQVIEQIKLLENRRRQ
jgi:radical SAM superfamily enzyme YgiQ (UPF0313 family)